MAVQKTLTEGLTETGFTHTNLYVQTIHPERQHQRTVTYDINGITTRDEWIGTSEEVSSVFNTFIPADTKIDDYEWGNRESFVFERMKGDLTKLTRTHQTEFKTGSEGVSSPTDPVDDSLGITPWSSISETIDIGAIEYYQVKFNVASDSIKRDRLALWEQSPIEYKEKYRYKTAKKGYITVDKNSAGTVDSAKTLDVAKWITENGRDKFPLVIIKISHEEVVTGSKFKKGKRNRYSLKEDIVGITFPTEFGKELTSIPDCPFNFSSIGYRHRFFMTDWNCRVFDEEGRYLVTTTYTLYPAILPSPIPTTTTK